MRRREKVIGRNDRMCKSLGWNGMKVAQNISCIQDRFEGSRSSASKLLWLRTCEHPAWFLQIQRFLLFDINLSSGRYNFYKYIVAFSTTAFIWKYAITVANCDTAAATIVYVTAVVVKLMTIEDTCLQRAMPSDNKVWHYAVLNCYLIYLPCQVVSGCPSDNVMRNLLRSLRRSVVSALETTAHIFQLPWFVYPCWIQDCATNFELRARETQYRSPSW